MYRVRPMTAADIAPVLEIEREAFPTEHAPTSFDRELGNKLARYVVLSDEGGEGESVLGYAGMWFIVDEAHLLSIAVREDRRRRGLGELLLIAGIDLALRRDAETMTLEVRVSNLGAQELYLKHGFTRVGRRRGYYTDNNEDAFLMTVAHLTDNAYRARLAELRTALGERCGPYELMLD